jgi:hypothetical protein
MVQNGRLVVDHARFESAPKVQQSQIEDASGGSWKAKTDSYWGGGGSTSGSHTEDHTRHSSPAQRPQSPSPQQDQMQSPPQQMQSPSPDEQQAPSSDQPPHS